MVSEIVQYGGCWWLHLRVRVEVGECVCEREKVCSFIEICAKKKANSSNEQGVL